MSALEKHPFFVTRPVVRTRASDGTEIWNYVKRCERSALVLRQDRYLGQPWITRTYSQFTNCMQRFAAVQ